MVFTFPRSNVRKVLKAQAACPAIVALLLAIAAPALAARQEIVQRVPRAYADLYSLLGSQLAAAEAQMAPFHPELKPQPLYAADLIAADANRGTDLLKPQAIAGVRAFLDALQQLGVRAVVFTVGYPVLLDRFPNSAQYLDFYKQVVAESRKRGMVVEIESAVLFTNSPFSALTWDYSAVPFAQFTQERHDITQKIVTELAPDYLELGAEPDTMSRLTGYAELNQPATFAQHIAQVISGIDRGSTKIGAGLGTWGNIGFVQAEVLLPLDFIGLHVYPIDSGSMATAYQASNIARAHGKTIVVDEAWLYKMRPGENTSIAGNTVIFSRDTYGFFAPLDEAFLHMLDDFGRVESAALISPFWSTFFFGTLPYTTQTAAASYADLVQTVNAVAAANVVKGVNTPLGTYYGALIAGRR